MLGRVEAVFYSFPAFSAVIMGPFKKQTFSVVVHLLRARTHRVSLYHKAARLPLVSARP